MAHKHDGMRPWVVLLVIGLPVLMIVGTQYLTLSRLQQVSMLSYESQLRGYLDNVSLDLQVAYRDATERALAISADAVQQRRFDEIGDHFRQSAQPSIKQIFVGVVEDCSCKTQYFDPQRGSLSLETDASIKAAVLRVSVPWRLQQGRMLTQSELLVDRQDPNNRILYRVVADSAHRIIGVTGVVIDMPYFLNTQLPALVQRHLQRLPDDLRTRLIVTATRSGGEVIYASAAGERRGDSMTSPLGLAFDDLRLGVGSQRDTMQQLAAANLREQMAVSVLMCIVILIGVGLTIRTERRSARLSQLKTDFVSNVTHELRTPLSSIALMGEFLRRGRVTGDAKIREYGSRIEAESYRLQQSVSNILNIAKIESQQRQYSLEETAIETIVHQALKAVDLAAAHKGFTVQYTPPDAPMPPVMADGGAIADAIVNIIHNAMKYSGASRHIDVRLEHSPEGVAVHVIDRGVGIATGDQTRIFEKFYRVADGPAQRAPGTGLGLAIVKHTVEAHGGRVLVSSALNEGSTFTILLPAAAEAAREAEHGVWDAFPRTSGV